MLLAIIIRACLVTAPAQCTETTMVVDGGWPSTVQAVAEWAADNPQYRIASWRARR